MVERRGLMHPLETLPTGTLSTRKSRDCFRADFEFGPRSRVIGGEEGRGPASSDDTARVSKPLGDITTLRLGVPDERSVTYGARARVIVCTVLLSLRPLSGGL